MKKNGMLIPSLFGGGINIVLGAITIFLVRSTTGPAPFGKMPENVMLPMLVLLLSLIIIFPIVGGFGAFFWLYRGSESKVSIKDGALVGMLAGLWCALVGIAALIYDI